MGMNCATGGKEAPPEPSASSGGRPYHAIAPARQTSCVP